jgi:hypothetical protein
MMRFHIYMQSLSIFKINLIFFSTAKWGVIVEYCFTRWTE